MKHVHWIVCALAVAACVLWTVYYSNHAADQVRGTAREMSEFCKGELRKVAASNYKDCQDVLRHCGCLNEKTETSAEGD